MNKSMKFVAVAAALICWTEAVRADPAGQILASLGKQDASVLCRKSNIVRSIFTLRAFEGTLCRTPYIAALAEAVCLEPNIDNYSASQCHKSALLALARRNPVEVLKEAVKNGTGKAREFVCGRTGIPDAVKEACP